MFKNSHRPNDSRQTRLKISLYFSVIKAGFCILHLCKCPDSVHLGFVFTVSLQDQGLFLLLRREPGQKGWRCLAFPPGWTQPGAGSTGLYPSPRLLRVCADSPRGCPSPPTLISVSRVGKENHEVRDPLGALATLSSPWVQVRVWARAAAQPGPRQGCDRMARLHSEPLWGFGSVKS